MDEKPSHEINRTLAAHHPRLAIFTNLVRTYQKTGFFVVLALAGLSLAITGITRQPEFFAYGITAVIAYIGFIVLVGVLAAGVAGVYLKKNG